ncbi:alpha/beta hydrolase [Streptomyces oryzae]|uniref:Alpha/beta hydrolase n=1 Tax=Streptomyces oryzae TaxID=1434886 RepID=A0ABS3XLF2_9ACTN|nr:alpha/beta hydrolase [Streptomyces oryzae]MBO8196134.1 alpha/beta hydrolase [Streptomyces oryzae]
MAQRALPERETRLGRPRGAVGRAPHAVVLVLPGGGSAGGARGGARGASLAAAAAAVPLARRLGRAGSDDDPLVSHLVRYRGGSRAAGGDGGGGRVQECAADAERAVEEVVRRYGDVPVCLVGIDIGAPAALRAAGHQAVGSVVALGPLLSADGDAADSEPVQQLRGRQVLIVHGTNDTRCDPELSFRLAERAKKVNAQVCRFEVHSDGHGLRGYSAEVAALTEDFVLGTLCGGDLCRPLTDALAAPPPLGLRMPLAGGFGKGLKR